MGSAPIYHHDETNFQEQTFLSLTALSNTLRLKLKDKSNGDTDFPMPGEKQTSNEDVASTTPLAAFTMQASGEDADSTTQPSMSGPMSG